MFSSPSSQPQPPQITEREALNMMTDEELFHMIDLNSYCIGSLDPERLTPSVVDYAMNVNNAVFYHIPKDKLTPFCARLLAAHDCCRFPLLPAALVTAEIQKLALEHYPLLLLTCDLIEVNEANCITAFNRICYGFLEVVSREYLWQAGRLERLSEISRYLLSRNTRLFKWIRNPTEEEWVMALGNHPELLAKAPGQVQTFRMCWTACHRQLDCVKYVANKIWAGRIVSLLTRKDYSMADPFTLVPGNF